MIAAGANTNLRKLFAFVAFLNAFLLFLVEPMAAKRLLPTFGGSASVWTTSLLFFQAALLAGYWLTHRFHARAMRYAVAGMAVGLLVEAFVLLRAVVGFSAPIGNPTLDLVIDLTLFCGLGFLALSAGSPLLQALFAQTDDPSAHNPYFLYAAGNVGSLAALVVYPLFIERVLGLSAQKRLWAIGLIFDAVLLAGCWIARSRRLGASVHEADPSESAQAEPISTPKKLLWVALAAAPTSLLMGVTTYLTTNVAPIPLLWVIPLALYLVTFILAFSHRISIDPSKVARYVPLIVTPLVLALVLESSEPLIPLALFHLLAFFIVALGCHSRLSHLRPPASQLTSFFAYVALGGALGGVFNAVIAPIAFKTLAEYPIALCLGCALLLRSNPKPEGMSAADSAALDRRTRTLTWAWPLIVFAVGIVSIEVAKRAGLAPSPARTALTIGVPAILAFFAADRPLRYGFSLGAVFLAAGLGQTASDGSIVYAARSFYGVHRVVDSANPPLRKLVHGNTTHGIESLDPSKRDIPLTYYTTSGPFGDVWTALGGVHFRGRVGVVGLGVGSLASYANPGQSFQYFEIDPAVIAIAENHDLFHFLQDCKGDLGVVEGDGRLSLDRQPNGGFDLLVLDAFSSDSIPVHLLTEEAVQLYFQKLKPNGMVAFHISNRYLDLSPILASEAADLGLTARLKMDSDVSDDDLAAGKTASDWLVMTRTPEAMPKDLAAYWNVPTPTKRAWTDDFSNLLSAFK